MKTKLNVAQVQGTQANYAPIFLNSNASGLTKTFQVRSLRPKKKIWMMMILLVFIGSSSKAQNGVNVNVANYGFEIIAPQVILDSGESAIFTIVVGTSETPVDNALEFEIDLNLGDHAELPQSSALSFDDSWFFPDPPPFSSQLNTHAGDHSATISGTQSPGISGHGNLFQIKLTSTVNGVEASNLIQDGGGMIMIDEVGFKMNPFSNPEEIVSVKIYPNPCAEKVQFNWGTNLPTEVIFLDMKGQRVARLSSLDIKNGTFTTRNFPPGIYHVVVKDSSGNQTIKKLLKR